MCKKIICIVLIITLCFSFTACSNKFDNNGLLKYDPQEFEICGLWAPREMSEEAFLQYKDAGFNVYSFTNHDELPRSSENQYYLNSKRSMEALKLCKKVGLDVYIAFGDSWYTREIEGDEYFEGTPFSKHNVYGEYMDIIKGVHISDEPTKEKMEYLSDDVLINDFKKIYPNKKYIVNLIPETAIESRNFENYEEMLDIFGEGILSKFEKPYISVDCYLHSIWEPVGLNILNNYKKIATTAKKYNANTTMILQSSAGNEFVDSLTEGDMRIQAYSAIAFGADSLQYYCYSVPDEIPYNYCMLQKDNKTPSDVYYYVKEVNSEIQSFASAVLAYDWNQAVGVSGTEDQTYRVCSIEYDTNFNLIKMGTTKHFVSAQGTQDLIVSHFTSKDYGDAYMLVNYGANNGKTNNINVVFKDCKSVAIYGGEDYTGTPEIVELDEKGAFNLEFNYGEGAFIVPLS